MSNDVGTEVGSIVDAIQSAATIGARVDGLELERLATALMVRVTSNGSAEFASDIQQAIEARLTEPRRRRGVMKVTDVDSFVLAVNRWKVANRTTLWCNPTHVALTALIDDNPAGETGAGWRDQSLVINYVAPFSTEWARWTQFADKDFGQEEFANFIDANLADVTTVPGVEKGTYPSPIELLEMARHLSIHTSGQFERKIDPLTGGGVLVVKDQHDSFSGKIWRAFPLMLRVFENGTPYLVEARIQFRIGNGKATFRYTLHRAEEIKADAFAAVRKLVTEKCEGCPMFAGTP